MERLHQTLADALRRAAPGLLPKLDRRRQRVRLQHPAAHRPGRAAHAAGQAAGRAIQLGLERHADRARERRARRLETDLEGRDRAGAGRARSYEELVADYKTRVDRRRPIDADVDYNWLWQKRIAETGRCSIACRRGSTPRYSVSRSPVRLPVAQSR